MSEHFPLAQPAIRLSVDGREGWRRSLPWWDLYFGVVATGTMLFTGDWQAITLLALMSLWYVAFGRPVSRGPVPRWQPVLYLTVATILLVAAVSAASEASFILFALSAQAHMMLPFGWAVLATAIMNLVPTAVNFTRTGDLLPTLPIAFLAVVLTAMIGYSIDRLIDQSMQLAESRAEVARLSREAERRRLGADLHDTIAQGLSSVLMLVQAADAAIDRDTSEVHRHLDLAARTARENLREIRAVLDVLMPTEQHLPQALRRLTSRFTEETSLPAELELTGDPRPLEIATEVVLLRSAQESLSNIRRHARATAVTMSLRYDTKAVQLQVNDDGCGFTPAKTTVGYGLEAMRLRVTEAGGTVSVESGSAGTAVRVVIPA